MLSSHVSRGSAHRWAPLLSALARRSLSSSLASPAVAEQPAPRPWVYDMTKSELIARMQEFDLEPYRARQLWSWIYQQGVVDPYKMTTFSLPLRERLAREIFQFGLPSVVDPLRSDDDTRKWLLRLDGSLVMPESIGPDRPCVHAPFDPERGIGLRPDLQDEGPGMWKSLASAAKKPGVIETVFIPRGSTGTACLSSQVGCSLQCSFCRTGAMSKAALRNLSSGEIVAQFLSQRLALGDFPSSRPERIVSNIVMMGMGEPLLNYRNLTRAVEVLSSEDGLALSRRRIIVSTSGIVPLIERMGHDLGVELAVSLHAVNDRLRDELVPINKQYPIEMLLDACRKYPTNKPAKKVTFEYVMLKGVNDSVEEARQLARLLRPIPSLVNLIPFNPWEGSPYGTSTVEAIEAFTAALHDESSRHRGQIIHVTVRWPRGRDIMAACGQLANKGVAQASRASALVDSLPAAGESPPVGESGAAAQA
ncbi:hypothetical protein H696_02243 [Fonticula alba]|uniref:Radical SAM core domain-containing protein n=1 Tax=Fonticula alba TaxID=691883 RepID=A0A058ZCY3_FONAL|nr:hypothetical protein H696_02243 [Fonticula alba]KCV71297.1 hypothetical protein H696_02243 [Fonticula alba]|eukprot:XP_009494420.1 hypothetical protein H696_02243 [Fonticula alba]